MRYAGIMERTPAGNWASSQISPGQGQNSKSSGEALEVSWQEVQKYGRNLSTATRNIKKPLFPCFPLCGYLGMGSSHGEGHNLSWDEGYSYFKLRG